MLSFRKRIQALNEHTTSVEVKNICNKYLNENLGQPEFITKPLLLEALKNCENKDSISLEFYSRLEKDLSVNNLGLKESLETVKSYIKNDPSFLYRFKAYENHLESKFPEHILIEGFIQSIQPYSFDQNIKNIIDKLTESYNNNETTINLKNLA
jgi:hypothetical protein